MTQNGTNDVSRSHPVQLFRPVLDAATQIGIDVPAIAAAMGIAPPKLYAPRARLSDDEVQKLVGRLAECAAPRSLPAIAAERIRPGDFGLIDFLAASGAKLGTAARLGVKFFGLLCTTERLRLEEDDRTATFGFVPVSSPARSDTLAEFGIATFTALSRHFTGISLRASEVRFVHPRSPGAGELEEFFSAPVRFDSRADEVAFPRVYLDLDLVRADASLHEALVECATALLDRTPGEEFLEAVRRNVVAALREGNVSLVALAEKLQMTPRTLQRRLQEAGTSLRDVVDTVRRELALDYVASRKFSLGHIALTLGFTDPGTFTRAFRRWTGATPRGYRATARTRPAAR